MNSIEKIRDDIAQRCYSKERSDIDPLTLPIKHVKRLVRIGVFKQISFKVQDVDGEILQFDDIAFPTNIGGVGSIVTTSDSLPGTWDDRREYIEFLYMHPEGSADSNEIADAFVHSIKQALDSV